VDYASLVTNPENWISLLTLTALEIVLGIDNIIFIAILAGRLPEAKRETARKVGLSVALVSRLILISFISFLVGLTQPLFSVFGTEFTGKAIILLIGGMFLMYKATKEIHHKLEGAEMPAHTGAAPAGLLAIVLQIGLIDVVFSLDSVITAVGLTDHISIMVIANIIALGIMIVTSGIITGFVDRHPSLKVLALSFLLMIGMILVVEAFGGHVPKGYIYFAMGFSVFVEAVNIRISKKSAPVKLHQTDL
jgi:predicted tellurium resistance membrane protein TerC